MDPVNDIIGWDIPAWSEPLMYWENNVDWSQVKDALELGSNKGGLSLWLALKGVHVTCSDLHNPESAASVLHRNYNVSPLISYAEIDATAINASDRYDLIVFKSILGGILRIRPSAAREVFRQCYNALRPGGVLLFAENMKGCLLHNAARKMFRPWGKSWNYLSIGELETCARVFPSAEFRFTGFFSAFGRKRYQQEVLAKADRLIQPLIPDRWKYIAYGLCKK